MFRRFVTSALFATSLLVSIAASAQEGGHDEVSLKNGGIIRGTVVSSEPGTSVKIIEMGQKEVRVIPWSQVSDVERGKHAPKAPAQTGPGYGAPPPAVEPALGTPGVVRLHLESPVPARVVEHVGTSVGGVGGYTVVVDQLRPVCSSPCGQIVDGTKGQVFAVMGGFPMPRVFTLNDYSGDVTVRLKPGSIGLRIGGITSIILGGSALVPGITLAAIGGSDMRSAGIGMAVGGGVALVAGIVMVATSGSKIQLEQGASGRRTGKIEPRYWMGEF